MANHPDETAWMQFLYGESASSELENLQLHLQGCSVCRQKVDTWRTTMACLDSWSIDSFDHQNRSTVSIPKPRVDRLRTFLSAAVGSAAVLLAFLTGRSFMVPQSVDVGLLKAELMAEFEEVIAQRVRAELEPAIKAQFAALKPDSQSLMPLIESESSRAAVAVLSDWARRSSADRQQLQQLLAGVLDNQVALRSDLENLAIEAEAQIVRTRRELVYLAMSAAPTQEPNESPLFTPDGKEPSRL